ncbi:hypothetical protein SPF06_19490 [Sinomonas sp. JGH33]|uniref:Uncharacterized protein n=1 Tax=Sinomonas terricola TaxID=3110330 RepID=A0ABU5TBK6_9MICC|nr:hypothetical protein [Sinomonas sp. JGH33]MEA5456912.1 hypothetical protein [Sinomonas sp. JGH33]
MTWRSVPSAGSQEQFDVLGGWAAQQGRVVGTPARCGEERTFQVAAEYAGIAGDELGDFGQARHKEIRRRRDERDHGAGGPVGLVEVESLSDRLGPVVEGCPCASVAVDVDESWGER